MNEEIAIRPRTYPKNSINLRKNLRKKNKKNIDNKSIWAIMLYQTIFCIILLASILIIKNTNTPLLSDNFIRNVKSVVFENFHIKDVFVKINDIVVSLKKIIVDNKEQIKTAEFSVISDIKSNTIGDLGENSIDYSIYRVVDVEQKEHLFINPVSTGTLGSPFGERIHPIKNTPEFHKGIDIKASKGELIKASLGGEVIECGTEATYGKYIKLKHKDNFLTLYAHCSELLIKKGQIVEQGSNIAKVGDTGAAIGSHLHFEVWKDGKVVDPLIYTEASHK